MIGYGSQGHAHALNLRDSGVSVRVGLARLEPVAREGEGGRADGRRRRRRHPVGRRRHDPRSPTPPPPKVYREEIEPNLAPGSLLLFAHGFNIRFGTISARPDLDVAMVAPKSPGHRVRELFVEGAGTPALFAIHQDATGHARALTCRTPRASA